MLIILIPVLMLIGNIAMIYFENKNNKKCQVKAPIKDSLITWAFYILTLIIICFLTTHFLDKMDDYLKLENFFELGAFIIMSIVFVVVLGLLFILISNLFDVCFCLFCIRKGYRVGTIHIVAQVLFILVHLANAFAVAGILSA